MLDIVGKELSEGVYVIGADLKIFTTSGSVLIEVPAVFGWGEFSHCQLLRLAPIYCLSNLWQI